MIARDYRPCIRACLCAQAPILPAHACALSVHLETGTVEGAGFTR